jgi:hypothetical protein
METAMGKMIHGKTMGEHQISVEITNAGGPAAYQ